MEKSYTINVAVHAHSVRLVHLPSYLIVRRTIRTNLYPKMSEPFNFEG